MKQIHYYEDHPDTFPDTISIPIIDLGPLRNEKPGDEKYIKMEGSKLVASLNPFVYLITTKGSKNAYRYNELCILDFA